ncbi:MAG TPA: GspH/FimT family pseudopilin [Verrucomicrobiae bacterium]|nr:GspH/FimT family pseudopilin [Verrucomicrobiae bacterium]
MKRRMVDAHSASRREYGFSLTELVVTLAVALILMAIGLPAFLRAYHSYLLTNSASQMADILRLSRYEAIRLNKQVNCQVQPYAGDPTMTIVWAGNGPQGTGDKMILLGSSGNLVDAGTVPQTGTLLSQAVNGTVAATPSPSSAVITFDARGAVTSANVNAFYLSSAIAPDAGYRAVLLMTAGSIQIWTADPSGYWQQVR